MNIALLLAGESLIIIPMTKLKKMNQDDILLLYIFSQAASRLDNCKYKSSWELYEISRLFVLILLLTC